MLSYMIYYEKFKKVMQPKDKVAFNKYDLYCYDRIYKNNCFRVNITCSRSKVIIIHYVVVGDYPFSTF